MEEASISKIWPAFSIITMLAFYNLSLFIFLAFKSSFIVYAVMIISNFIILPSVFLFLELSGYREKLWNKWKKFPLKIHKFICAICVLWIGVLSLKALIPALKKSYEKN